MEGILFEEVGLLKYKYYIKKVKIRLFGGLVSDFNIRWIQKQMIESHFIFQVPTINLSHLSKGRMN